MHVQPGASGRFVENRARAARAPGGHCTEARRPAQLARPWLTLPGRRHEATQEDTIKSQKAEKQAPQKQAPQQRREADRPQPDQPRRQDQGRIDEEDEGFGGDEEESDR